MGNNESKGLTLTEKIIKNHIIDGEMIKGTEIGLRIDQTLTQRLLQFYDQNSRAAVSPAVRLFPLMCAR